jgi:sorting nexin-1/2
VTSTRSRYSHSFQILFEGLHLTYYSKAKHDLHSFSALVDEHIRFIGSAKTAYGARARAHSAWTTAQLSLSKKQETLSKLQSTLKVRTDKVEKATGEVQDATAHLETVKTEFETLTRILRDELERLDLDKASDFTKALEAFLIGFLETQRQSVALWKSYFELQKDL